MGQNVVEYILEYLQNPKTDDSIARKNIFINAEGGAGKTTAFIEIYRRLLKDELFFGGQRLIPVYIPLTAFNSIENTESEIKVNNIFLRYLYEKYDYKYKDYTDYEANISKLVLDAEKCQFRFLFMLDAINEKYEWQRITSDILNLSKMKNVCVIVSSRTSIAVFDSWHNIELSGISSDVVASEISGEIIDAKTRELLSIPFYMAKYKELEHNKIYIASDRINRYTLLSVYFDFLFSKQLATNSRIIIGKYTYEENLKFSRNKLLPMICFVMMRKYAMVFSSGNPQMMKLIKEILILQGFGDEEAEYYCSNIREYIESFFVSTGIFIRIGDNGKYRISHEIYRDFLAAEYIVNCIKDDHKIADSRFKITSDALKLISFPLFGMINMTAENGEFIPNADKQEKICITIKTFWGDSNSEEESDVQYFNFAFIYYNLIETFKNGSSEKAEFCKSTEDLLKIIYNKLILYIRYKAHDYGDFEVIRLYAEVLRRNRKFSESIVVSRKLAELAGNADKWNKTAIHNEAKCYIYEAFDIARMNSGFSDEAYEKYCKGLNILHELNDGGYTLSSNLYAMLVAYPDPVSERYMYRYLGDGDKHSRRMKGFFLNLNAARKAYLRNKNGNSYNYPLKQCMIAMMNKDISYTEDAAQIECLGIAGILDNTNNYSAYNEAYYQNTLKVAAVIMKYLREKDYSFALECLQAKLMLLRGDDVNDDLITLLQMSSGQAISIFTMSLLLNDNDINGIENTVIELKKKAEARSPDSFDAIYIQTDLKAIWENIIDRGYIYTEEYRQAVNDMLTLDL